MNDFASTPELILLPAVDVADGKAVRLTQGEAGTETSYGDPVDAALAWARDGGDLWQVLQRLEDAGCSRYVVTDVTKDGTLKGPNLELLREVTTRTVKPVVASGGISNLDDIAALRELVPLGVEGAIVGKALSAGAFTLAEALDVAAAPLISTTLDVDVLASAQPGVRRAAIAAWLTERGAPSASWVHVTAVEALVTDWHGQRGIDVAGGAVLREEGYLVYVPR